MNFYLSCLLAFPKTKNGILGFWEFGTFFSAASKFCNLDSSCYFCIVNN